MRFPELPTETVIFLFRETSNTPLGTAFIVGYPIPGKESAVPLVVTAKERSACLFIVGVKNAEGRILALTQKNFYEAFMKERQACSYRWLGIEIAPAFCVAPERSRRLGDSDSSFCSR